MDEVLYQYGGSIILLAISAVLIFGPCVKRKFKEWVNCFGGIGED